jgi:hypothetical protein
MSENYFPPFNITAAIISLVAEISQRIGRLLVLEESSQIIRLRRTNRIRTIQGSLAIEGNTLSVEQITPGVTPHVTPEVRKMLSILKGEMTRKEIQQILGLKDEKHFRTAYQQPAIAAGLIEMTVPDKPNSRLQKYRITPKGVAVVKEKKRF